ncbi:hypothetical protein BGLA2_2830009 [Burkholderia gladioli]|nr:hypothetical protein BGLA2_2830009 [Burkholderia gladioli]
MPRVVKNRGAGHKSAFSQCRTTLRIVEYIFQAIVFIDLFLFGTRPLRARSGFGAHVDWFPWIDGFAGRQRHPR